MKRFLAMLLTLCLGILVGCTTEFTTPTPPPVTGTKFVTPADPTPTLPPAATNRRVQMEPLEPIGSSIPFDGIRPIYEPEFSNAADVPLSDEELVMGVVLGGEAKAYPITVLRFREMVNDELAGIPILVTW